MKVRYWFSDSWALQKIPAVSYCRTQCLSRNSLLGLKTEVLQLSNFALEVFLNLVYMLFTS